MPGSNGDDGSLALPDSGIVYSTNTGQWSTGNGSGGGGLASSIISAGGQIASSLINARSQADLMKYSTLGSNGFLFTSGKTGQPATIGIGSTTLILVAVAAIVVLFLFTRKGS